MLKNYAGVVVVTVVTIVVVALLCPILLMPHISQPHGTTVSRWMGSYLNLVIAAYSMCALSLVTWIYLSAVRYPIDITGRHTQMPYWIMHALPPILTAVVGLFLLPSLGEGGLWAMAVLLVPLLLQFWISSLLFSPHPGSIPFSKLLGSKSSR